MDYLKVMGGCQRKREMKNKLYCNKKIDFFYHNDSHKHEVISVDYIEKGEVIEETAVMLDSTDSDELKEKIFKWPKGYDNPICDVFVQGFGSFFRRSNSKDISNINWECDLKNNIIIFTAIKDIDSGEFLTLYDNDYKPPSSDQVKKNIRTFLDKMRDDI